MPLFHPLTSPIDKSPLDDRRLNNPFYYVPDACSEAAAEGVRRLIAAHADWHEEVERGKMFGALVVEDESGQLGFLAAYSGQLGGREDWDGFVPAVFDYLSPHGTFKTEEGHIIHLNQQIASLLNASAYQEALEQWHHMAQRHAEEISAYQAVMREAKTRRDALRATATAEQQAALIRESQFMKAELRRIKRRQQEASADIRQLIETTTREVTLLKEERRQRSDALQRWLFSQFVMVNGHGEERTLLDIFSSTPQGIPPSGAGECCAPKLLQYALRHHLRPLRIIEFWQGASPLGEIRHHNHFYPACRSKCLPILRFMLQGIDVAPNPLDEATHQELEIVYDDAHLVVVNKPAGMLSVPGKSARESVYSILRHRYPQADGPMIVHRLDMDTSGLLVAAKSEWMYHALQRLFETRKVKKRYIALLEGDITCKVPRQGTIRLPLRPDINDRPRQMVDYEHGKEAVTQYEILGTESGHTRIALYPLTGRTHQLRLHCAHAEGLGCPILGDRLYGSFYGTPANKLNGTPANKLNGTPAGRLYLHAERLELTHPATHQPLTIESKEKL